MPSPTCRSRRRRHRSSIYCWSIPRRRRAAPLSAAAAGEGNLSLDVRTLVWDGDARRSLCPSDRRHAPRVAHAGMPRVGSQAFRDRLIFEASGKFSLLEVPADAVSTVKAEDNRQSLLRLIERAETEWMVPEKLAGKWGATPAAHAFPVAWPKQSIGELADLTYRDALIEKWIIRFCSVTARRSAEMGALKTPSERAATGGRGSSTPNTARREVGRWRDVCAPWICSAERGGRCGWQACPGRPARSR